MRLLCSRVQPRTRSAHAVVGQVPACPSLWSPCSVIHSNWTQRVERQEETLAVGALQNVCAPCRALPAPRRTVRRVRVPGAGGCSPCVCSARMQTHFSFCSLSPSAKERDPGRVTFGLLKQADGSFPTKLQHRLSPEISGSQWTLRYPLSSLS